MITEQEAASRIPATAAANGISCENALCSNAAFASPFPGALASADKKCLFVFHIPRHWSDDNLARQFIQYGQLTLATVTRWPDTTSRGFGFVAFEDDACAQIALQEVDGKLVDDGKRLRVSVKKTKDEPSAEAMYGKQSFPGIGPLGPYPGPIPGQTTSLPPANSTCFVFYVPSNWDDEDLKSQFARVGTVVSSHVARKQEGTSRGFGFVSYATPELASAAVAAMNGVILGDGKRLKVSLKTDSSQGTSLNSQYTGAAPGPYSPTYFGCNIFVASFPANWTEDELRSHFLACGKIVSASIRRSQDTQESAPYGFVTFDSPEAAQTAVAKMNGVIIGGRKLRVSVKRGEERTLAYAPLNPYGFSTPQLAYNPATAGNFVPPASVTNSAAAGFGSMGNSFCNTSFNGIVPVMDPMGGQFHQMGFDPYQFYSSLAGSGGLLGIAGMPGMTGLNGMGGMTNLNGMTAMTGMNEMAAMTGMNGIRGMSEMSRMTGKNGMTGMPGASYTDADTSSEQRSENKGMTAFAQIPAPGGASFRWPNVGLETMCDAKHRQATSSAMNMSGWSGETAAAAAAAAALGAVKQESVAGRISTGMPVVDFLGNQNVTTAMIGGVKDQNSKQASAARGSFGDGRWDMTSNIAAMQQLALMQQWQQQQQQQQARGGVGDGGISATATTGTHPMMTQYNIPGNLYGYGAQNVATAAAVPTGCNPLYGANPSVSVQRK